MVQSIWKGIILPIRYQCGNTFHACGSKPITSVEEDGQDAILFSPALGPKAIIVMNVDPQSSAQVP